MWGRSLRLAPLCSRSVMILVGMATRCRFSFSELAEVIVAV